MITLPPVAITGKPQLVDLTVNDGCCALLQNESGYALEVAVGATKRWLGAWEADLFDVPSGVRQVSWVPKLIGSLFNAPSSTLLVTVAEPGERFHGTYPLALTRQAAISAGVPVTNVNQPTPVSLQNGAGQAMGDVSGTGLGADVASNAISTSFTNIAGASAVLASFKAAAGQSIALVGSLGGFLVGSATAVAPAFGQATSAGSLLVAWVTSTNASPTTSAAGWVQAVVIPTPVSGLYVALWYKKNCGAAEAAPAFTAVGGAGNMQAQLAEFSGADTSAPLDKTSSAQQPTTPTITVSNSSIDAGQGDLVLLGVSWSLFGLFTLTFTDTFNNGAAVTHAGDGGAGGVSGIPASFAFAINPSGVSSALPMGSVPWDYDAQGTNAPAAGSAASVVLAATPGKIYRASSIDASIISVAAAAVAPAVEVLDGATVIWQQYLGLVATADAEQHIETAGRAIKGTTGNSLTLKFTSGTANIAQTVNLGAYLR